MSQQLAKVAEKVFKYFGEKTDPLLAVLIIAGCKAIFRPTFTMADKHQTQDRKVYTALREFLTEVVAVPSYFIMSKLSKNNFMANKLTSNLGNVKNTKEVLSFIGICLTAGLVIPSLCNLLLTPVMKKFKEHQDKGKQPVSVEPKTFNDFILKENINYIPVNAPVQKVFTNFKGVNQKTGSHYNFNSFPGMRIGG